MKPESPDDTNHERETELNSEQMETEDLNTQMSNKGSGNAWETQLTQMNRTTQGKQN